MKASFPYPAIAAPETPVSVGRWTALTLVALVVSVLVAAVLWLAPVPLSLPTGLFNLSNAQALPASYQQGMQLRQKGDLVHALQKLEQAAIAAPDSVPVLYELGRAEFQLGEIEDAIAHYRTALVQDPNHAPSAYELGGMLVTLGNLDEGIALLQRSVELAPTVLGYYDLGIALGRKGDRDGEIARLNQAIAMEPNYADAHLNLGLTYARMHNIPLAKQHLQQARALYQAEIEALEEAHLGRNSLDAQIIDQMMLALDSGCGVQCWQRQSSFE